MVLKSVFCTWQLRVMVKVNFDLNRHCHGPLATRGMLFHSGSVNRLCETNGIKNCHRKKRSGRTDFGWKMVPDHSWLTKNGLAGPILVTKSGPPRLTKNGPVPRAQHWCMSPRCVLWSSSFSLACSCFTRMNWHLHSTNSSAVARACHTCALKFRLNKHF